MKTETLAHPIYLVSCTTVRAMCDFFFYNSIVLYDSSASASPAQPLLFSFKERHLDNTFKASKVETNNSSMAKLSS